MEEILPKKSHLTQAESEFAQKELRLKVATRQAGMYRSLESSLDRTWPHIDHPLIQKVGLADFVLGFQLSCKNPRDELTQEVMGLMVQLGISGDEDE